MAILRLMQISKSNITLQSLLFYLHRLNENILRSNHIYHFIQTCKSKGMVVNILDNHYKVVRDKEAKSKAKKRKEELIDNVLENEIETSQLYKSITKRLEICKISVEEMEANPVLKDILTNDHNFSNHLNLCNMIEKKGAHDADLNKKTEQDFKEHVMKSTIAKVKFIKKVEAILKIDSFDIDYDTHHTKYNNDINLEEAVLKLYKKVFADSSKKTDCKSFYDVYKILINCYKNLFGRDIVVSDVDQKRIDGVKTKITKHSINKKLVNEHLQLFLNRRKSSEIDEKICKKFDIKVTPEPEVEYMFQDHSPVIGSCFKSYFAIVLF